MFGWSAADQLDVTFEIRSAPVTEHTLAAGATGLDAPPTLVDADDVVSAHTDGRCVGEIRSTRTEMTVPGEVRLTVAALGGIAVDPDHRGRGVLTAMCARVLADAQARGQVLATITSPHSAVHPRLGFGVATESCAVEIDAARARPLHRRADGTIEVLPTTDALDVVVDVYERCARRRTGTVARSAESWKRRLAPPPGADGVSEVAVHHDSTGRADGYALHDRTGDVGVVRDLWGESAAIERSLWAHLFETTGVTTWRSPRRPHRDPVRFAVADARSFGVLRHDDELWLRLLDLDVALAARSYHQSTRTVTIKVTDPVLSPNNGTWRIDSYGSFRSQGEPDLELGIEALSAGYLGGTSFHDLAEAGRIVVRRPGAADDADALFAERPTPFCGTDR